MIIEKKRSSFVVKNHPTDMTKENNKDIESLNKKLDELIETKKDEASALRKIYESFGKKEENKSSDQNQKK